MSRTFFCCILVVFLPSIVMAQFIDNKKGKALTDQPFFNEMAIEKSRINCIEGRFLHYKLGDRLRETDLFRTYSFNQIGQLTQQTQSTMIAGTLDTLVRRYAYNDTGQLKLFTRTDQYGKYGYAYQYDSLGRIVQEEFRQFLYQSKRNSNEQIELGKDHIIYTETSSYQIFDKQQIQTVYNSIGKPYKKIYSYYTPNGLLSEEVERLERTSRTKKMTYLYNEELQVDTVYQRSSRPDVLDRTVVFSYDEKHRLVKKEEYKDGEYITQSKIIYNKETGLINDILVQNVATDFIRILKLNEYFYSSKK